MYVYFHRTMEEFTLPRPYVMKKYKEPSEKQNLKKHYNILYAFTLYLYAALLRKSITIWEAKSLKNTITFFFANFITTCRCCCVMKRHNEAFDKQSLKNHFYNILHATF